MPPEIMSLSVPFPALLKRRLPTLAPVLALAGCAGEARTPSLPLFGSFFPTWILCAIAGVIVAVIVRGIFIRTGLDEHLPVPPLVYLSLAVSGGIVAWFIWSGVWP